MKERVLKQIKVGWKNSSFEKSVRLLTKREQKKIILIALIQIFISFLDLFGIITFTLLGSLVYGQTQNPTPLGGVQRVLELVGMSNLQFETQCLVLICVSLLSLGGRTLFSIFFTRRILFFLSLSSAKISAAIVAKLLSQSLLFIQGKPSQQFLYASTRGVEYIFIDIIATSLVLLTDLSLLLILLLAFVIVDPLITLQLLVVFLVTTYFLNRFLRQKVTNLGNDSSELIISSNSLLQGILDSFRLIFVSQRQSFFADAFLRKRHDLSRVMAEISFMPYISKYVFEVILIVGVVIVGLFQIIFNDSAHAIQTILLVLAASTRLAPSLLRIQSGLMSIRRGIGQASSTFQLLDELGDLHELQQEKLGSTNFNSSFISKTEIVPEIRVDGISFNYPNTTIAAISDVTLFIPAGAYVAIVGPSGSGKSTLADLMLGILIPTKGTVTISDLPPLSASAKYPGAISYVPQDTVIMDGTFRENIAFGYRPEEVPSESFVQTLRSSSLQEFIANQPEGLESQVGERGTKMSGGQRQRLGLARALLTQPRILVLDEATSSLDGGTEEIISNNLAELHRNTTVVVIAHRLSTVRKADIVIYLSEGKVLAIGNFEEVRLLVPAFEAQANLMGL